MNLETLCSGKSASLRRTDSVGFRYRGHLAGGWGRGRGEVRAECNGDAVQSGRWGVLEPGGAVARPCECAQCHGLALDIAGMVHLELSAFYHNLKNYINPHVFIFIRTSLEACALNAGTLIPGRALTAGHAHLSSSVPCASVFHMNTCSLSCKHTEARGPIRPAERVGYRWPDSLGDSETDPRAPSTPRPAGRGPTCHQGPGVRQKPWEARSKEQGC